MKSFGLVLAAVCVVLFTGIVLHQAGWFDRQPSRKPHPARDERAAAFRHGLCQPTHWRAYILQR